MLLCRRPHLVTPFRMCPRRRLISRSPRYLLTWQCRRLPTVFTPHLWMLPCRRSHTVLFLRTFLRRWVLAQLPRFLLICLFRLLFAVRCYTIFPHNYRSRSSLLDASSRTILLIVSAGHRHQPADIATTCSLSSTSHASDGLVVSGPPKLCLSVPVISTRSTCLAAATARTRTARTAFRSRYWFSLVHYTWHIYYSCTSTSPATFSYFSFASTAPCLYHPCGNTSCTFSHYRQEKCQYCSGGNAQSCYYRFSYRVCSFS